MSQQRFSQTREKTSLNISSIRSSSNNKHDHTGNNCKTPAKGSPLKSPHVISTKEASPLKLKPNLSKLGLNNDTLQEDLILGAAVYVRLDVRDANSMWYRGTIASPLTKGSSGQDSYLVDAHCTVNDDGTIETSDETMRLLVTKPNIALAEPTQRIIPVSSHVIADLTSGIVAEKPNLENDERYLIFFENGVADYFPQSQLLQVAQGRYDFSNISVDMPVHYRVWLQDYFERYPKRLKPKYRKNELTVYNIASYEHPIWKKAQIIRAKKRESFITIKTESTVNRGEFTEYRVYRASPKLLKYHQLVAEYLKKNGESFKPSVVMDMITSDRQKHSWLQTNQSSSQNGSGFTLSIRRLRPAMRPQKLGRNDREIQNTLNLPVNGDKSVILSTPPPTKLRPPYTFKRHTCQPSCVQVKVDLMALRGLNPFFLPIYFGFRKEKNDPFYVSPCGTILDSLNQVQEYLSVTECILDIDFFTFEPINIANENASRLHPCFTYKADIANGLEFQPISLINFTDRDELDPNLIYVSDRMLDQFTGNQKIIDSRPDEDIEQPDPFLPCCDCTDNCSNAETCACIQLTYNEEFYKKHKHIPHDERTNGYEFKRLADAAEFGIYECNSKCPCNKYCPNRVVQNGIKCALQIFKTPEKGWGVRTLYDIPQGTFVSTYSAKVMRDECVTQLDVYTANIDFIECAEGRKEGYEDTATYEESELYDLESGYSSSSPKSDSQAAARETFDTLSLPHKRIKKNDGDFAGKKVKSVRDFLPDEDPYVLDAQNFGNIGRFYNHSCDPNMFIQNVFIDTHDLRLPHVAFFTNRSVKAFDELTWDYSYEPGSVPNRTIYCKCATDDCRRRLL